MRKIIGFIQLIAALGWMPPIYASDEKPLADGTLVKLVRSGEGQNLQQYVILQLQGKTPLNVLLWSMPLFPSGGNYRPADAGIMGIEAVYAGQGVIAVLLRGYNQGFLIRRNSYQKTEMLELPSLMDNSAFPVDEKFTFSDPYTIQIEKRGMDDPEGKKITRHTVTVDAEGRLLYDGKDYSEAVLLGTLSTGRGVESHEPKGEAAVTMTVPTAVKQNNPSQETQVSPPPVSTPPSASKTRFAWLAVTLAAIGLVWLVLRKRRT